MLHILADREVDEQAWLKARRSYITASESCHLVGTAHHKWRKSPQELYNAKQTPIKGTGKMRAGQFWEDGILAWISECTGVWLQPSSKLLGNTKTPGLAATPDACTENIQSNSDWEKAVNAPTAEFVQLQFMGEIFSGPDAVEQLHKIIDAYGVTLAPWEVKNQASKDRYKWNKDNTEKIAHYVTQSQHQQLVMEQPVGFLAAKVDANELYIHVLPADSEHQQKIKDCANEYHRRFTR